MAITSIRAAGFSALGAAARVVAWVAMMTSSVITFGQDYPNKPVRIIVPFASGGAADIVTRIVAQQLSTDVGEQFIVDLRPGAGGGIGTAAAAKAPADGYTLVMGSIGTHAINSYLYSNLPYYPVKDFTPLSLVAAYDNVLVANPSFSAKTVQDVVAMARQRPGAINYAHPGDGTTPHLAAELFQFLTKTKLVPIGYKGGAPAITDLLGGHVPLMFPTMGEALPHIKRGALRALGTTGSKRSPNLPDVPTIAEAGVAGYEMSGWIGLLLPAGTPTPIVQKLSAAVLKVMKSEDIRKKLSDGGATPIGSTPEEFAKVIKADLEKWERVVKSAGIRAQ